MEQGFERRRELDAAIVAGKRAINAADDKLTTSFVQAYVDNAVNPGDVVRALPPADPSRCTPEPIEGLRGATPLVSMR
jgi:hypothetical protein